MTIVTVLPERAGRVSESHAAPLPSHQPARLGAGNITVTSVSTETSQWQVSAQKHVWNVNKQQKPTQWRNTVSRIHWKNMRWKSRTLKNIWVRFWTFSRTLSRTRDLYIIDDNQWRTPFLLACANTAAAPPSGNATCGNKQRKQISPIAKKYL